MKLPGAAFLVAALVAGAPARAAESASDRALAETLFRDARDLMDKGQTALACPKFAESYRLDAALGTLLNLAVCHEQVGQLASAWARYGEAVVLARKQGDSARQQYAEEGARRLEGRFATLRLSLAPELAATRDLTFELDQRELGRAVADTPIPVDPGKHALVVKAPGYEPWSTALDVARDATRVDVQVPALKAATGTLPVAAPATQPEPPPPPVPPAPEPSDPGATQRLWGYVAGGAGIVGVGVALGFGAHALSKKHERDDLCPNGICATHEGVDAHREANTAATIANVAGGVGIALLGTGLVLVVTAPHAASGTQAARSTLSFGLGSVSWTAAWE